MDKNTLRYGTWVSFLSENGEQTGYILAKPAVDRYIVMGDDTTHTVFVSDITAHCI